MQPSKDLCDVFASHVASTHYEGLPAEAADTAKKSLLDTLGVILAASGLEPSVRSVVALARESGGKPESLLLGFGGRLPAASAALVNGALAHCLDFDDRTTWGGHAGSSLIPAVLALAERKGGISGKRLISAIAVGQDIFVRLRCNVLQDHEWNVSTVMGVFAAAAGAAQVLGLSAAQTAHALGIASMQSSGTMQLIYGGSHLRGMYAGFSAKAAVIAALLADKGLTGIDDAFEGRGGILPTYFRQDYDREGMLAELGEDYLGADMLYKPWPVVGLAHTYIHATTELMQRHRLVADDIEQIQVFVAQRQKQMCVPVERRRAPETAVDAKFSLPFCIALAAMHGEIRLSDFTAEALRAGDVRAMAARVVAVDDESAERKAKVAVGRVQIVTRDGHTFSQLGHKVPGSPEAPMGWDSLAAKFRDCANAAAVPLTESKVDRALDLISRLEGLGDVAELSEALG
ncbi:MmgE/PrpD family protein [Cupriavidus sp. P-10]|uniref:MmgE/PrpD family protein n=1 Tax=Cupriavidus sp. P-10 TaxID=2027911 RepID=UPI000E2E82D2|nr:MmgE/PrpD family protein [Cupriavidus sp. P-10]BDB27822.1 MmgE/PrpD family protein [Cupriavidus sp. P-10]